jgi:disulfide bond formation protein DsbB
LWIDRAASRRYAIGVFRSGYLMVARLLSFSRTQPVAASAAAIAAGGILTILGAFYFQYVLGYRPCPLCLEQRVAYYVAIPLAAMILLGLSVGSSRKVMTLALLAIAAAMLWNAGLGVYHSGVEWQWWPGPQDCAGATPDFSSGGSLLDQINRTRVVRCDEAAWRFLGLSLAGYNVLISLALAAVALWGAAAAWKSRDVQQDDA